MEIRFESKTETYEAIACVSSNGKHALNVEGSMDAVIRKALAAHKFAGKPGQIIEILAPEGLKATRLIVLGVGKKPESAAFEKAGARLVRTLATSGLKQIGVHGITDPDMQAHMGFGALLASHRFDTYRTSLKSEERPSLESLVFGGKDSEKAAAAFAPMQAVAEGVELARDLVSEPPNVLYPEAYAQRVSELSKIGLKVSVLDEKRLGELGMNLLLGVGQGSVRQSCLCVLEWQGADDPKSPPLALVGKGVTFDTGGISIKPSASMDEMKGDMGGSAAVVGAMRALAGRKAKANVVGVIGLVENMPGGQAIRPGDIIESASGQMVEVLNTDAEGRLVLADALWYAQKFHKPCAMVNLATLTGAIIIALGYEYAGLFSNDDKLARRLGKAGDAVGEAVWRLPMGSSYDKMLNTPNADMKNISGGRAASSITAAQFLKRFVNKGTPWAHLDIASKAWTSNGDNRVLNPIWATGFGVRLLNRLIADSYED